MTIQKWEKMLIYSKKQVSIRVLLFDKTFTKVLAKYFDYNNIFLAENVVKLLKNTKINRYVIKLKKNK